jgi:anhydro-N-acetylmuramic acid kinase
MIQSIIGFDVCCANQLLNYLAGKMDKPYDEYGAIAESGIVRQDLLMQLNAVTFFALPFPKSLDNGFSSRMRLIPIIRFLLVILYSRQVDHLL